MLEALVVDVWKPYPSQRPGIAATGDLQLPIHLQEPPPVWEVYSQLPL